MILFINTLITETRLSIYYDRGRFQPSPPRFDIFRYTLASLATIPWKDVFILYQLDNEYQHRYAEMDEWIGSLFEKGQVFHERCEYQSQWRTITETLMSDYPEELVWFLGNDDHVFIDSDLAYVTRLTQKLDELRKQYPYVSLIYSHWPQFLGEFYLEIDKNLIIEDTDDYALVVGKDSGSAAVWSTPVLEHFWLKRDFGSRYIYRADTIPSPDLLIMIPKRELVRHFDGYAHAGVDIAKAPPLRIPPGFFEKQIKISYGDRAPDPSYLSINPFADNYAITDPNGAEFKCHLDDIPLFWRPRIAEVKKSKNIDEQSIASNQNRATKEMALSYSPLWKGNVAATIPAAFRKEKGEVAIASSNTHALPRNVREIQYKKRNWSDKRHKHSIVLLDKDESSWEGILPLAQAVQEKEEIELLWVSLEKKTFTAPTREKSALIDSIITCRFREDAPFNKNIALNLALENCTGEVVTVIEFVRERMYVAPNLIEEVATHFWSTPYQGTPLPKVIRHGVSEVQSPFENNVLEPQYVLPASLHCCTTFRREDIERAGRFSEDPLYDGARGGAYELYNRIAKFGVKAVELQPNGHIYFISAPFPGLLVPYSEFFS